MEIKSISVPSSPRSKRYPAGSTIIRNSGGGTTVVGGGGSSLDVLKSTSGMPLSDANVLSSLRALIEIRKHFVSKDDAGRELTDTNSFSSLRTVAEIDKAIADLKQFLENNYLSKVKDDRAAGTIAFEKDITVGRQATTLNLLVNALAYVYDLQVDHVATLFQTIIKDFVSSDTFVPGMAGEGMKLYKALSGDWNLELDNVTVRKAITTFEMVIAKIRAVNGGLVVSAANGSVKSVSETTGDPTYYVLGIEGDMTFVTDDLVRCQVFTSGRVKHYWVPIEQVNEDSILILKSGFPSGVIPAVSDELVQMGNRTDPSRQGVLYLTASEDGCPRFSVLDGINSPSLDGRNNTVLGCMDGITDTDLPADFQPSGYGLYSMNVFLKGIFILRNGKSIEEELTELSTQIEAIPGQISLKVTEEVGKMQIGGRNYVLNSHQTYSVGPSSPWQRAPLADGMIAGETYILSLQALQDDDGVILMLTDNNNISSQRIAPGVPFELISPKKYFAFTNNGFAQNASFYNIKIEKGTKATDWTPAPEDIETRMSQAELNLQPENIWLGIKSKIQIGGRNYYKKSTPIRWLYGSPVVERIGSSTDLYIVGDNSFSSAIRMYNVINSNGYWTISFDIRGSQGVDYRAFRLDVCDNPEITTGGAAEVFLTSDDDWHHHEYTFNVQNYSSSVYNFVDFESLAWAFMYVRNIKIEKGTKATDWTPAPEDITEGLADTGIDIANRKIVLSADKTVFRNNSGGEIAVFENNRIKANLIDARQIIVDGLNAGRISTGNLDVTEGANIGPFEVSSGGYITAENKPSMIGMSYGGRTSYLAPGSLQIDAESGNSILVTGNGRVGLNGNDFRADFKNIVFGGPIRMSGPLTLDSPLLLKSALNINIRRVYGTTMVDPNDSYIVCVNSSNITLTLPPGSSVGHMVYIKRQGGGVTINCGVYKIFKAGPVDSVGIGNSGDSAFLVFDGTYWNYQFIGR